MAWLLRGGEVLASIELATPEHPRRPSARDDEVPAVLRRPARVAYAFGIAGGTDLAWLDDDFVVQRTCHLPPYGFRLASRGANGALFAECGAFERWGLRPGDQLEVKD